MYAFYTLYSLSPVRARAAVRCRSNLAKLYIGLAELWVALYRDRPRRATATCATCDPRDATRHVPTRDAGV